MKPFARSPGALPPRSPIPWLRKSPPEVLAADVLDHADARDFVESFRYAIAIIPHFNPAPITEPTFGDPALRFFILHAA